MLAHLSVRFCVRRCVSALAIISLRRVLATFGGRRQDFFFVRGAICDHDTVDCGRTPVRQQCAQVLQQLYIRPHFFALRAALCAQLYLYVSLNQAARTKLEILAGGPPGRGVVAVHLARS